MNSYYEKKLATGEVKCIDEEIPFEIPQGWEWCRLNDLYNFIDYRGATPHKLSKGIPLITAKNVKQGYLDYTVKDFISSEEYSNRLSRGVSHKGDILFTTEAPLGNVAIADLDVYSAGQRLITLQAYIQCYTNNDMFMFFMLSPLFQELVMSYKTGTTVAGIKASKLKEVLIPTPPISEQSRIVKKIQTLLPFIEKYSRSQTLLNIFNTEIKDKLRKSFLQEAIQGKLVPQIVSEGTAQELLEQIKAEKRKLVKEGKLKKSTLSDSIIFRGDDNKYYELIDNSHVCIDEFLPFQIPETWTWCKVKDLLEIQTGASFKKEQANANKKGIRILRGGNILPNKYIFKDDDVFVSEEFVNANTILKKNCIITPAVTSLENIGKMAVIEKDYNNVSAGGFVFIISPYIQDFNHSLLLAYFLQSPFLIEAMRGITKKSGAAFYNLGKERLKELYLPLPPMAEQSRIVGKINEVLSSIMSR